MMRLAIPFCLAGSLLVAAGTVRAQEMFIYPDNGQSEQQMEQDKFECYGWAKSNSGFDPMAPPTATAPPPKKQAAQGGAGRGALRGLAVGSAVGAISGSGGKQKRATGAAVGGLVGGMRRQDQKRSEAAAQKQWEDEQVANYQRNRNNYNRAYGACLEGRSYTVR